MRTLIDLTINEAQLEKTVQRAKEQNIIVPTIAQMKNPDLIPQDIKDRLKEVELEALDPVNLFRISWYNEPKAKGGLYNANKLPNYIEIPSELSGVKARILAMSGKFFPIGAHKVGAAYACLVPRLVTGQFDPTYHEAVWPSTGNYCRGGAFNSKLLGCKSIAILPENMSTERFNWLKKVAGEVITTPGSESNVKEIYDETWRLRRERPEAVIFNQFGELANNLWHYEVTGSAMQSIYEAEKTANSKLVGVCLTSGSAGTLGSGDYIKNQYPGAKLAVGEAIECRTLLDNGFGEHWIEGIGDKHVPWIHNVKNSDMLIGINDADALAFFRLVNEAAGQEYLKSIGIKQDVIDKLTWIGISGAANILMAIKFAKYYELTENDCILTVLTDSATMYQSRLAEMKEERNGTAYTTTNAAVDHAVSALENDIDYIEELTYATRKRVHNLKYYTWIEQQQYDVADLNAQWYDYDNYWDKLHTMAPELDALVEAFNKKTGLVK